MAGRAQQKKHKRSVLVDGDEMAAGQQQKEVWLLQSQLAEGLLAGLAEEDIFEAQALLASVHQNRYQAEAEQLSTLAERHLHQKSKHRSGVSSLGGGGGGGKRSKDEIKKEARAEEALEKMKRQAARKSGVEKEEQEKRTRQLEALRKWKLKSGTVVLRDV
ncbi:uncharacterized protein ACA1_177480 [Acanthamoeba castellanii str. Neff]|uniref:Uncharacterized protein n=1 Tax=Acanthamoeba castellanii (strain ATCC 30010 / Neff) TaxID=1257118 RepID=L8GT33_ACACF|nr:uncharacterized protein ACA1_177480 [Acanthamoeba castellanii str. Neff]ELR16140.1 hypothetical protein ACA1_177480 [Acanthamoeba castellanii str. Neff]